LLEWIAAYRVGLDDSEWQRNGIICETIQNESYLTRCTLANQKPKVAELRSASDYIPKHESNGKVKRKK